jgi:hypothetical protein
MVEHSVVFNMRIQMPGTKGDGAAQISYGQMMATFDRTRREGHKDGWVAALTALREAAEKRPGAWDLEALIRDAADSHHCPYPRESREERRDG